MAWAIDLPMGGFPSDDNIHLGTSTPSGTVQPITVIRNSIVRSLRNQLDSNSERALTSNFATFELFSSNLLLSGNPMRSITTLNKYDEIVCSDAPSCISMTYILSA